MLTRLEERLNHATLFAPRRPASGGLCHTTVVNIVAPSSTDGAERRSDAPMAGSGVASIRQTFRGLSRATRGAIAANRLIAGGAARRTAAASPQDGVARGRFTTLNAADDAVSWSADSDESVADSDVASSEVYVCGGVCVGARVS